MPKLKPEHFIQAGYKRTKDYISAYPEYTLVKYFDDEQGIKYTITVRVFPTEQGFKFYPQVIFPEGKYMRGVTEIQVQEDSSVQDIESTFENLFQVMQAGYESYYD